MKKLLALIACAGLAMAMPPTTKAQGTPTGGTGYYYLIGCMSMIPWECPGGFSFQWQGPFSTLATCSASATDFNNNFIWAPPWQATGCIYQP